MQTVMFRRPSRKGTSSVVIKTVSVLLTGEQPVVDCSKWTTGDRKTAWSLVWHPGVRYSQVTTWCWM